MPEIEEIFRKGYKILIPLETLGGIHHRMVTVELISGLLLERACTQGAKTWRGNQAKHRTVERVSSDSARDLRACSSAEYSGLMATNRQSVMRFFM